MRFLLPLVALLVGAAPEGFPQALQAESSQFAKWRTPASDALAARLSKGEATAYTEVFRALEAKDEARAREAAAALASVDTMEGWGHLRRQCRQWEASKERPFVPSYERGCGLGVPLASLQAVARRARRPLEELLMEAARHSEPGEAEELHTVARVAPPAVWKKLTPLVARARPEGEENLGLRAFIARMDSDVGTSEPEAYRIEASKLEGYKAANDRKALLAYARNPKQMYVLRLYAAYHLAVLGDGSALGLFEDRSYVSEADTRLVRDSLEELLTQTQGSVRETVKPLLPLYPRARDPLEGLWLDTTKSAPER